MSSWKESIKDLAQGNWSLSSWAKRGREDESNPLTSLQRQMNSLFDDFVSGWGSNESIPFGKSFVPKVNFSEDEERLYVSAELPGLDQKDVELTLTPEALTIRGEKHLEREQKESESFYKTERSYGVFQRVIPLSCEVDTDKVDAVFKNGLLTISLTKTPSAQARSKKIAIRS